MTFAGANARQRVSMRISCPPGGVETNEARSGVDAKRRGGLTVSPRPTVLAWRGHSTPLAFRFAHASRPTSEPCSSGPLQGRLRDGAGISFANFARIYAPLSILP